MAAATEVEPRRSVRATKGQHTKSFDELEPTAAAPPKRRQTKKSKKAQEQEQEQETTPDELEEIIRCICGATEQDEDSGEAWIGCETCLAWQHNVCVGVSSFEDEIPDHYYCERCRPEDHKELLEGMARGEKPWEARRKAAEDKKKRKGGRKGKGKRASDQKDKEKEREREKEKEKEEAEKEKQREREKEEEKQRELEIEREKERQKELEKQREEQEKAKEAEAEAAKAKAKPSPAPAPETSAKDKKETTGKGKRKAREDSQDAEGKASKIRRVSAEPAQPQLPQYTAPDNIPDTIKELPGTRSGPANALKKSIAHVFGDLAKHKKLDTPEGQTVDGMAEKLALQIERAVYDTHPTVKGHKEYNQQIKSLAFNLKSNPELVHGLLEGHHTPPILAVMTSDQLASAEKQRQTAEMKARVEKQSILLTQETGPRVRRTHKGEEVVEDENQPGTNVDEPMPLPPGGGPSTAPTGDHATRPIKDESVGPEQNKLPSGSPVPRDDSQHTPTQSNFDIGKVFSSVRSPSISQPRRPSAPVSQAVGPGEDADVDRMLQDENDSPPYSPTEEAQDPDVVWRGNLAMSTIANFPAVAKHIGGANFALIEPWSKLIPQRMSVAGRIQQQNAVEYLCSLRYGNYTDVIVVNLEPASPASRPQFIAMIDYFVSKKRYGVVGDKVAGNVRDTYLVPVPAGEDNHPEFMLNLVDNNIPKVRTEPMLLAVFVYRSDPTALKLTTPSTPSNATGTPTPAPGSQRHPSTSGPTFSPATPIGGFKAASHPQTPVPIPQPPYSRPQPTNQPAAGAAHPSQPPAQLGHSPGQQQHPPHQQYQQQHLAHQQQPQPPPQHVPAHPSQMSEAQRHHAQLVGQAMAQEVLGPELIGVPTVQFLLPQAYQMSRKEWDVIRNIFEKEPRAREDLQHLGGLLDKAGKESAKEAANAQAAPAAPADSA